MGILVQFRNVERPNTTHPPEWEGAKVVIFPGVRYERRPTESPSQKSKAVKRKRKRG